MSINELKEKTKKQLEASEKKKMALSEMFEDQSVGKPAIQKENKPEVQESSQLASHNPINPVTHSTTPPESQPPIETYIHKSASSSTHTTGQPAIQHAVNQSIQSEIKPDVHSTRQPAIFSTKPIKGERVATIKATFNIREDIHKAFTDLYAYRLLKGRPSEKSAMICEAIQLLIMQEEKNDTNN